MPPGKHMVEFVLDQAIVKFHAIKKGKSWYKRTIDSHFLSQTPMRSFQH